MEYTAATASFVREHANDDVRRLALEAGRYPDIDIRFAIDQIQGLQKARTKLPSWAATDGLIFPPHISMEQCSSEQTALYKVSVMKRVLEAVQAEDSSADIRSFTDMTGGFGVDFSFLAKLFETCRYVERQEHLCDIARHNLSLLGLPHAEIVNGDSADITFRGVIFIDPARRDINGKRTFAISDCTPDILSFLPDMLSTATLVMVKLSPMLDWHATIADLHRIVPHCVRELHIISAAGECKELLLVLRKTSAESQQPSASSPHQVRIFCVSDTTIFTFNHPADTQNSIVEAFHPLPYGGDIEGGSLLLPNPSIMKAGCFSLLTKRFPVRQVAPNSHLFIASSSLFLASSPSDSTSIAPLSDFPGKRYTILSVTSLNKKELKTALQGIDRANISTRNFPMSPEELRRRLKIKDGGEIYIFATTTGEGQRLFITKRAKGEDF